MPVRLSEKEINIIKNMTKEYLGECEIYIFGSRTDLNKKGRDIDIYVIPKKRFEYKMQLRLKAKLEETLLKPVDLIISSNPNRPIEIEAKKGVKIL
ncbi:nucleotidyltransferase family protein [Caminibacter sp.]